MISMLLPLFSFGQPVAADPIPGDLVRNGDFSSGVAWPWHTSETWPARLNGEVVNGEYCVTVTSLKDNIWDAQMRHRRLTIEPGHHYVATFTAYSPQGAKITAKVAQSHDPWKTFSGAEKAVTLTTSPMSYTFEFDGTEMADTFGNVLEETAAEFTFHVADNSFKDNLPYTICFDDISLVDVAYVAPVIPSYTSAIRVNQHGYFVYGPKKASVLSSSTTSLVWQLGQGGILQATGTTTIFGYDAASGDYLHTIDFSDFHGSGENFYLGVLGITGESYRFSIADNLYSQMKFDALAYFYHNRDQEILTPYVAPVYARGAMLDANGEPFDLGTPCYSGPAKDGTVWENCVQAGTPQLFPDHYQAFVYGGWYDAGDHGKYVVNAGISAWTLMNLYERNRYWGSQAYAYGNGTLSIPESQDPNYPESDLLDEVWNEVYFMQTMQVRNELASPEIQYFVHHMIHDTAWTDIPNRPDEVLKTVGDYARAVYPPSTAATLNFAAAAAQFKRNDAPAPGPDVLLPNAERAWDAATAYRDSHPYAPYLIAEDRFDGGGGYPDPDPTDEFYWAACELYITTGKQKYLTALQSSPYYLQIPKILGGEGSGPMAWGNTAALGTISLATVPNGLPQSEILKARRNIIAAANTFIANEAAQGYGTPYVAGSDGYAWGSNSFVLNEMIIMGLAYDFTKDIKYLDGMVGGMDYLLGRNAMDKSYVSGYGDNSLQNPHHRFWAYQGWPRQDLRYPQPPAGAISGGPNSTITLEDCKTTQAMGMYELCRLTPQKCYVDDIEAFTVNEVTINWNAPFAWVTSYLDEVKWYYEWKDTLEKALPTYTIRTDWRTGATIDIVITNNGTLPIKNWTLDFTFPGNQRIYEIWNAGYSQTGRTVKIWSTEPWNDEILPGATVSFGFNVTYSGVNRKPTTFEVGGEEGEGTPDPTPDLTTVVHIFNDWGTGYCANVTVTNNTAQALDWQTTFTMPSPGSIYDFWNVNWTQNGSQVTISGIQWNNILQPGESTHDIGYCANR
ncbi:MAG: glycoside hydrolase family 9 protein [Anaerolineae bacterium]|nr:glycoside hydrolase family 9 protein [Anaerolineae bacterium]